MEYRPFGATGLSVSAVGFGGARLGGVFGEGGRAGMLDLLRRALDEGITFYDTADLYTQGESERLIGEAFRGRRDRVVIASKVGYTLPGRRALAARVKPLLRPLLRRAGIARRHVPAAVRGTPGQDFSPAYIVRAAEASLRRLGTDYLDLYQLHSPPPAVLERGEFIEPLEQLRREGKIRHWGVACDQPEDALLCFDSPGLASIQVGLSLLHQEALDAAIPQARARGVAVIARQCYASGQLAKPLAALTLEELVADAGQREARRRTLERYHALAERSGRPLAELALQFDLGQPGVAVTLVGMRTAAHLADTLRYLESPLTEAERRPLAAGAA